MQCAGALVRSNAPAKPCTQPLDQCYDIAELMCWECLGHVPRLMGTPGSFVVGALDLSIQENDTCHSMIWSVIRTTRQWQDIQQQRSDSNWMP